MMMMSQHQSAEYKQLPFYSMYGPSDDDDDDDDENESEEQHLDSLWQEKKNQKYQQQQPHLVWEIHANLTTSDTHLQFYKKIRNLFPGSLFLSSYEDTMSFLDGPMSTPDHVFKVLISSQYDLSRLSKIQYDNFVLNDPIYITPIQARLVLPTKPPKNHCTHCLFIPLPRNMSLEFAVTAMGDKMHSFLGRLIEKPDDYKIVIPRSFCIKYRPCTVCKVGRKTITRPTGNEKNKVSCFQCRRGVHLTEIVESHDGGCYIYFQPFVSPICISFVQNALDGSHWGNKQKHVVSARWCREI